MQHRALNERRVAFKAERALEDLDIAFDSVLLVRPANELVCLPAPALTTDAGNGGLHPAIGDRDIHREVAAHRVTMHAEALRIDLRLLLKKSEPASATKREQIPVVVLRMLAVFKDLLCTGQHRAVALHIELRGIDHAPVGVWIAGLGLLAGIERSLARAAAAPVHGERCVTTRHEQLHLAHGTTLATAMDVHHRREFFLRILRKAIHRRHPRWLAFERSDEIPNMAKHRAVLFPLANHLDLQGVLSRIKIGPEVDHRLRHALRGKK